MKVEVLEVAGFSGWLESLRKPFREQVRSKINCSLPYADSFGIGCTGFYIKFDNKDLALSQALIFKGDDHAKALRSIQVWLKINAPRYFWSELETYTVGVTKLPSESTMHTLLKQEVTEDDFEPGTDRKVVQEFISKVHGIREIIAEYPEVAKTSKRAIKQILPEGYLQERVIMYSYQALRNIYFKRRNHDLPEWQVFCKTIEELPLAQELIICEK